MVPRIWKMPILPDVYGPTLVCLCVYRSIMCYVHVYVCVFRALVRCAAVHLAMP